MRKIEYKTLDSSEFSSLVIPSGTIYHQCGNFSLLIDGQQILPVNRSYTADVNGNRRFIPLSLPFIKDRLVHEIPDRELIAGEITLDVYGSKRLFLSFKEGTWYDSKYPTPTLLSTQSLKIIDFLKDHLSKKGLNDNSYILGVFGSHLIGINGPDSDLDLIAWVDWTSRQTFIEQTREAFAHLDYLNSNSTSKFEEYSIRYAKRIGLSHQIGEYLALKRVRWIQEGKIPISMQCLDTTFDHQVVENFLTGLINPWSSEDVILDCNLVSAKYSYNLPKVWTVKIGNQPVDIISFSWTHQGMGDDMEIFGDKYVFKGAIIDTSKGKFLYLREQNHYLLPKKLVHES